MAVCCDAREESLSIPELARRGIDDLFSSEMKPSLWYTVIPKNAKSPKCTPSDEGTMWPLKNLFSVYTWIMGISMVNVILFQTLTVDVRIHTGLVEVLNSNKISTRLVQSFVVQLLQ